MNKDFIVNLAFLVAINLIVKPIYIFGVDVGVQNQTGSDYGLYFALLNFTYIFLILGDLGIQQYNNRQIAQNNQLIGQLFPDLLAAKLLLLLPFFAIAGLAAWIIGYADDWRILLIIMVNQLLVSMFMFLRSNVSGLGMYRKDSFLSVLDKLFMIIVCGWLLIQARSGAGFTIFDFLFTQTASFVFVCVIALWFLRGHSLFDQFKPRFQRVIPLLQKTWPFGLAVLFMTMYTRLDGVMIERLIPDGAYEASVYAGGYRLLDAANMFAFLFPPLLLPMFAKLQNQRQELRNLLKLSFGLMWSLVSIAAITCFFFRQELMDLLYIASDVYWGRVFGILILNFVWIGLIHVFGTLITAMGKMRDANIIFFTTILINIALNLILIPDYGAWGAALATFITHGMVVIGLAFLIRSDLFHRSLSRSLFQGLVMLSAVILINALLSLFPDLHWMLRFVIVILLCAFFAFSIRIVDLSQIRAAFFGRS